MQILFLVLAIGIFQFELQVPISRLAGNLGTTLHFSGYPVYQALVNLSTAIPFASQHVPEIAVQTKRGNTPWASVSSMNARQCRNAILAR